MDIFQELKNDFARFYMAQGIMFAISFLGLALAFEPLRKESSRRTITIIGGMIGIVLLYVIAFFLVLPIGAHAAGQPLDGCITQGPESYLCTEKEERTAGEREIEAIWSEMEYFQAVCDGDKKLPYDSQKAGKLITSRGHCRFSATIDVKNDGRGNIYSVTYIIGINSTKVRENEKIVVSRGLMGTNAQKEIMEDGRSETFYPGDDLKGQRGYWIYAAIHYVYSLAYSPPEKK